MLHVYECLYRDVNKVSFSICNFLSSTERVSYKCMRPQQITRAKHTTVWITSLMLHVLYMHSFEKEESLRYNL